MVKFSRKKPIMERSFALRIFNRYETEINEHYWSFKAVSEYARHIAASEKKKDANFPAASAFHASGPDAVRIPPTVSDWLSAREELENWLRLSALVSAVAYHEAYLRQITRSALMSAPLSRIGASSLIDGVVLLKSKAEFPFNHEVEMITKGEWSSREANFRKLFGDPNNAEAFSIREMERMRKLRNEFAHGFGRDISAPEPSDIKPTSATRLSHSTLIKYLGILSKSATAIDGYLLEKFIGNFELIHCYHSWIGSPRAGKNRGLTVERAFQRHVQGEMKVGVSTEFCSELIKYYNSK